MKKRMMIIASIVVVISVIFSCSKESTKPTENEIPTYEETGVIDENGGIVQITDDQSDLIGTYINIPENALDGNIEISISQVEEFTFIDTSAIVVDFTPSGTQFSELVEIGIPYQDNSDISNLQLYTYNEENEAWEVMMIDHIDTQNQLIISKTNHFSYYTSGDYSSMFDVELYKTSSNKIGVHIQAPDFNAIPTRLAYWTDGYLNMEQCIDGVPFDAFPKAWFRVTVREDTWWFPETFSYKALYYDRYAQASIFGNWKAEIKDRYGSEILQYGEWLDLDELSDFYSGLPLIIESDSFDTNEDFTITVEFYYSQFTDFSASATLYGRFTPIFSFAIQDIDFSDLSYVPSSLDEDDDNIINNYDEVQTEYLPPLPPSNPSPPDNAINISINTNLYWDCSDPDEGDQLTYDVYFGTDSTPDNGELVSTNQTSTSYNPGTLSNEIDFYWKIVAHDDHSNTTTGDVWHFETAGIGQQPPSLPTNPSPTDGAQNIPINNVSLSWTESIDPNGDDVEYWVALNTDNSSWEQQNFVYQGPNNYCTISDPLEYETIYFWVVYAVDEYGNESVDLSDIWQFTTMVESSGEIPTDYIAYYPFNGNAYDESGNGNNGTENGATLTNDRFGNENSAYWFDGINDWIDIDLLADDIANITSFSFNAWLKSVYSPPTVFSHILFSAHNNSSSASFQNVIRVGTSNIGGISFAVPNSENDYYNGFNDGVWHNITIVISDNSAIGFLDNNEIFNISITEILWESIVHLSVGQDWDVNVLSDFWNGEIDDIRIYNRVLTANEINALYHEGGWDE